MSISDNYLKMMSILTVEDILACRPNGSRRLCTEDQTRVDVIGSKINRKAIIKDRWMDALRFYVLFNSVSLISGRWKVDNERMCAMELRLRLRRFRL